MKICPYCKTQLDDDSLFCTECGKQLPQGAVCPNCGAEVFDEDVFCGTCGYKLVDASDDNSDDVRQEEPVKESQEPENTNIDDEANNNEDNETTEDKEEGFHFDIMEYKRHILGGLFLVILFGAGWWYYDFSSQRAARERAIADSLEVARLDSIKKSVIKLEKEKNEAERKKREEEARLFCEQLSLDDLIGMVKHYDKPEYFQKKGLNLIYKDVDDSEEVESIEIVYGRDVEKTEKRQNGYGLNHTLSHCCFFMVNIDTSTSMGLYFGNKDDANHFFERALKYGLMEHDGYYYVPRKKLPKGDPVHVDTLDFGGDESPIYIIHKPEYERGFFCININEPI